MTHALIIHAQHDLRIDPVEVRAPGAGEFSLLPLTQDQVVSLRENAGIYLVVDGRINLAWVTTDDITVVRQALAADLGQISGLPSGVGQLFAQNFGHLMGGNMRLGMAKQKPCGFGVDVGKMASGSGNRHGLGHVYGQLELRHLPAP